MSLWRGPFLRTKRPQQNLGLLPSWQKRKKQIRHNMLKRETFPVLFPVWAILCSGRISLFWLHVIWSRAKKPCDRTFFCPSRSMCQVSSGAMADLPEKDSHSHDPSPAFIEHCNSMAAKALEVKLEYTPVLYCRELFFELISDLLYNRTVRPPRLNWKRHTELQTKKQK